MYLHWRQQHAGYIDQYLAKNRNGSGRSSTDVAFGDVSGLPGSYGMDAPTLNGIDVPKWKC